MPHFPVIRWGDPYESLEVDEVVHFATGEALGEVSQANAGLVVRDMRKLQNARDALRKFTIPDLCSKLAAAADLFMEADLPVGGEPQSSQQFVKCQSATTGLPEHMCHANMQKLHYVLSNLETILAALSRKLNPTILSSGYAIEDSIMRSRQANTAALGMVLPSNSPGTHGLWLPVVALQIGLVLKPGPQEPWTPYRMTEAYAQAGIPREAIALYPGGIETGKAVVEHVDRTMIFGSLKTVDQYRGHPGVQVHGPGFSKILIGDDCADDWEQYLDILVDSVVINSGRSCINCSSIWTPRHSKEIADAMAQRMAKIEPLPPDDPNAPLAAFTVPQQADGIDASITAGLNESGVEDMTARHRTVERLIREERYAYVRPTLIHADNPSRTLANTEYMFPFASVVECKQEKMLEQIGGTLVGTVISNDDSFRAAAVDSPHIDRLNLGPMPTFKIDWLQPHEGNIIDFLYRERALQIA